MTNRQPTQSYREDKTVLQVASWVCRGAHGFCVRYAWYARNVALETHLGKMCSKTVLVTQQQYPSHKNSTRHNRVTLAIKRGTHCVTQPYVRRLTVVR